MMTKDLSRWMWSEALALLDRADRLHRQFARPGAADVPAWEPPVDIIESRDYVRVSIALPGVAPESIAVSRDGDGVRITAQRAFPVSEAEHLCGARIRALEIPHGRFERRITIPSHTMTLVRQQLREGCLHLIFGRKEAA